MVSKKRGTGGLGSWGQGRAIEAGSGRRRVDGSEWSSGDTTNVAGQWNGHRPVEKERSWKLQCGSALGRLERVWVRRMYARSLVDQAKNP